MKVLTIRLGQFAFSVLALTVLFQCVLNLCLEESWVIGTMVCAIVYGSLMYLLVWYFGKKDVIENGIHDIGFRFHLVTYILCNGIGYGAYYLGWNAASFKAMAFAAMFWGIGLLVHFILFLIEQKKTIKGYAKEELFQ